MYERVRLNILYSRMGWDLQPQHYIVAAAFAPIGEQQPATTKTLEIKWIYVDPADVETPPNNQFYQYFQNLWKPLTETLQERTGLF